MVILNKSTKTANDNKQGGGVIYWSRGVYRSCAEKGGTYLGVPKKGITTA